MGGQVVGFVQPFSGFGNSTPPIENPILPIEVPNPPIEIPTPPVELSAPSAKPDLQLIAQGAALGFQESEKSVINKNTDPIFDYGFF